MTRDKSTVTDEIPTGTDAIPEQESDSPGGVTSAVADGARDGSIALLAGGAALLVAARSATRGRLRAILQLAFGAALVRVGLSQRRTAEETVDERVLGGGLSGSELLGEGDESEADEAEPRADESGEETGDGGEKETSDEAHAAVHDDASLEPEFDDRGGDESDESGTDVEASTDVTFANDEPRSKPDVDAGANDPRRNTDGDEIEVDVSEAATADEASEATGPEQPQPTRTEDTESEPGPEIEEDAADMRVEPSDGEDDESDAEAER